MGRHSSYTYPGTGTPRVRVRIYASKEKGKYPPTFNNDDDGDVMTTSNVYLHF
jgi:hypothetical protein